MGAPGAKVRFVGPELVGPMKGVNASAMFSEPEVFTRKNDIEIDGFTPHENIVQYDILSVHTGGIRWRALSRQRTWSARLAADRMWPPTTTTCERLCPHGLAPQRCLP